VIRFPDPWTHGRQNLTNLAESSHTRVLVYRPARLRILILLVVVAAGLGAWWLYDSGKLAGGQELVQLRARSRDLQAQVKTLSRRNDKLQARLAVVQRSSQVDRQAYKNVKGELASLQDKVLKQREELAFYRGILAPGEVKAGLHIQGFKVDYGEAANTYHYQLVLTQLRRYERWIKGTVDLSVIGTEDGKSRRLPLSRVSEPRTKALKFRFRYFQNLEGDMHLPKGFVPQTVEVKVRPAKRHASAVERTFDWPT